jgi:hypothetical protein
MKKIVVGLLFIPFFTSSGYVNSGGSLVISEEIKEKTPVVDSPIILPAKPIDDLVNALIYVESRGSDSAIGDKHLDQPSVGVLQIRPIMVREVNRICKRIGSHQRFTLRDRFDRKKSIHMFLIWKEFHHKDSNFEAIARSWNGGPRGPKSNRTLPYWEKVEKQLNNQNN